MDIFTGQFSEVMVVGEFNVDLLTVNRLLLPQRVQQLLEVHPHY